MGYLKPTAIIVTGSLEKESGEPWIEVAHARALECFGRPWGALADFEMVELVSPLTGRLWNNTRSFTVHWDGSTEGWTPSDECDKARAEFVQWLQEQVYDDGSSPLQWVEISYCDDDGRTMVLATAFDQRNRARARQNVIRLEIDEPLKSAHEWAELDGLLIKDPDGWRDGVEELPAQDPMVPIARGEYERRVEVSTVVQVRS